MAEVTRKVPIDVREFRFRKFRLVAMEGPDAGRVQVWSGDEFGIGTAVGNQLVLSDAMVSRHHCVIEALGKGFRLRDLGSTNGTKLGGFKVEAAYLTPGAVITCGQTKLLFESVDGDVHEPLSREGHFERVLGRSPLMRRIFAALPRIASSDATVLLVGETGTGKGLMAEAIHAASQRAGKPFIVVDCSSIPSTLIESELLGHEKGSFTGAHAVRPGSFELARGGTVFLDEIGELPTEVQPKLLRALEERVVRRVGGAEPIRLDVRVIAATNRDLRRAVNEGTFRADLLYRLNTFTIRLPPLRERREDIPPLIEHFYAQFGANPATVPAEFVQSLMKRDLAGNVRELRSLVERKVLVGDPYEWEEPPLERLQEDAAPASDPVAEGLSFRTAKEIAVSRWERVYLVALIARHDGNLSRAARAASMDRTHLRDLLRRHGLLTGND